MTEWIDWGKLERNIPLDDLPRFHREFLQRVRPDGDWDKAPLRQVQGKVQASLKQLEREGRAKTEGDKLLVARDAIPNGFQTYLSPI